MLHASDTACVVTRRANPNNIMLAPRVASVMLCTPEHAPSVVLLTDGEALCDMRRRVRGRTYPRRLQHSEFAVVVQLLRRDGVVCVLGITDAELLACTDAAQLDALRERARDLCLQYACP